MAKRKKINKEYRTIVAVLILLSVTFGLLIASNPFFRDSNSYFARIRVAIKKKVQIVYNQNLFDGSIINNSGIKEYDSDKQEITFDGKLEGNHINLGKLNVKLKKGERYRVTINYLSGSYDKEGEPKFIFELQKNGNYYDNRKNGTHYIFEMLPTKKDKPIDKVLTIKDEVLDATNIIYRIYQENEVEFKNYKIQVSITKLESKIGVAGDKYGSLPTPEKDGYEFLGWYDSISGGKKITKTNTILKKYNHPLYAHWQKAGYDAVNYKNFKWTYYQTNSGPLKKYASDLNPYAIWAPNNLSDLNGVSLPLIIWLHGDNDVVGKANESKFLDSGLLKVMKEWNNTKLKNIPAIIVAPQSSSNKWAGYTKNKETIEALVEYAKEYYKIDTEKIVLMGHAMGGNGAIEVSWELKDKIKLSNIIVMSSNESQYQGNEGKAFYSAMKIRGYGERVNQKKFFDWIGKSDNYRYLRSTSYNEVPQNAMIEDINKNGVSDLSEWLFNDGNIFDETYNSEIKKRFFIGDSRTVGMFNAVYNGSGISSQQLAVGNATVFRDTWSCRSGMRFSWMKSTGIPNIEKQLDDKSALIILMGVNGYGIEKYTAYFNEKLPEWTKKGVKVYFVSINPCNGNYSHENTKIDDFNAKIKTVSGLRYIDTNTYLKETGFYSGDGLHYNSATSNKIYEYIITHLN